MRILSTSTSIAIGFGCIIVSARPRRAHNRPSPRPRRRHHRTTPPTHPGPRRPMLRRRRSQRCPDHSPSSPRFIANNPDVASAGVRSLNGELVIEVGRHAAAWKPVDKADPSSFEAEVPITQNGSKWTTLEIRFVTLPDSGLFNNPSSASPSSSPAPSFFGAPPLPPQSPQAPRPPPPLSPTASAPCSTLSPGVIVMDNSEQIVARPTESFCRITNTTLAQIQGKGLTNSPASPDTITRATPPAPPLAQGHSPAPSRSAA